MINYISLWARQVILAVLIAIILEMILFKDSKNTKYVKTVIGIYIMYVIISPGLKLLNKGKIDFSINNYSKYFLDEGSYNAEELNIENISLKETYELNIKQDIEQKLREKGYIVSNIKLNLNMNTISDNYGEITKLEIKVSQKNKKENNTEQNNKIIVEKINISNSEETTEKQLVNDDDIKTFLRQEYGVNNIIIR